jgi:hypothetical protein
MSEFGGGTKMQRKMAGFVVSLALFAMTTYGLAANQAIHGQNFGVVTGSSVHEKYEARPVLRPIHITSANWAGYAVVSDLNDATSGIVTDVVGQWNVPSVSASRASSFSAVWIGIDGHESSTIQQIGTSQDNQDGVLMYYAWYEIAPDPPILIDLNVSPGNSMSAEVRYIGANQFTFTLNNLTTGDSFSTTETVAAERRSAEWVVEAPSSASRILPLANFGSVTFRGAQATLAGHTGPINDPSWGYTPITMVNRSSIASPSSLSSGGTSFSVSWETGGTASAQASPTGTTSSSESTDRTKATATPRPTSNATPKATATPARSSAPTATGY